jgi:transcriptional regulator with XRE-family HTH domain
MEWYIRLERLMRDRGWAKAELARRSGVSKERVYKYLAGRVGRPDDEKTIRALAAAVGVPPVYLMYGIYPPGWSGSPAPDEEPPSSMRRIPRIRWEDVGMLHLSESKARKARGTLPVPDDSVSEDAFYTDAPDDANAPDINKGDLLICDPKRKPVIGRYVIARIVGKKGAIIAKYTVTQYQRSGAPGEIKLAFRNPDFGEGPVFKASSVVVVGPITHRTSSML